MQFFALLGGSGSGKTALSLDFAKKFSCVILSLDSLSIYQEIDIASAKPSPQERAGGVHFVSTTTSLCYLLGGVVFT